MQPFFTGGMNGYFAVLVVVPFLFVSFDVIPQSAEEVNIPARQIGKLLTNHFGPRHKLLTKTRTGAKVTKAYDAPATPYQRVLADTGTVSKATKGRLKRENRPLNPAAIQRQIQALCTELLTLTTAKQGPKKQPAIRAKSNESTNQPRRCRR